MYVYSRSGLEQHSSSSLCNATESQSDVPIKSVQSVAAFQALSKRHKWKTQ
jgi:hypothetical protein